MTHGETSTGMLNQLEEIVEICKRYNVLLCVDCVSSFGALPFRLDGVFLATSVSGKAIGTMSGLAFVFANEEIQPSNQIPTYLDIGLTTNINIPHTMPSQFIHSLELALMSYEDGTRFELLKKRMHFIEEELVKHQIDLFTDHNYPMIFTWQENDFPYLAEDARMSGFNLHYRSDYLMEKGLLQISCIQPDFEVAWTKFMEWRNNYLAYHAK